MPVGRNDPCPCGSPGKKYKACCLNAMECHACGEKKPLKELRVMGGMEIRGKVAMACLKCIAEAELEQLEESKVS